MTVFQLKRLTLLLCLLVLVSACAEGEPTETVAATEYAYQPPEFQNDGWQVGHLTDHGFDESTITTLIKGIVSQEYPGINSISIVRNRTLLLYEDFRSELTQYDDWVGNRQLNRTIMHSTSKSFVSAMVGIAIEQGYIESVEVPFYDFFAYEHYKNWDSRKQDMTLENVLTMQLGLRWDEWDVPFGEPQNSLTNLVENNQDYVKALLDLPLDSTPGTEYAYNTVASIALGAAVENATAMKLEEFAETYLFQPMQISNAIWLKTPTDRINTGSGLFLQTRDMAKLGQLYLDQGVWQGSQLINPDWINNSLQRHVELNWEFTNGYGFQWWLGEFSVNNDSFPFYSTRGYGGQFIVVVPNYDLVIAFTAENYENDLYDLPFKLVEEIIIPAIIN